jgi:hypothetical protein
MKAVKKGQRDTPEEGSNTTTNIDKKLPPNFLLKLYQILETNEFSHIIEWADNGKYFLIKNLPEFTEKVLPRFFKHNNFASFVRQVTF